MGRIIGITDFSAPELDVYARLTEAQLMNRDSPEDAMFIAESPLVIGRALDAGYEPVSLLVEKKHIETQAKEMIERCPDIPVFTAEFDVLTQLTGFMLTRGMLCAMKRPETASLEDTLKDGTRIAVLENVQNPTNVGAIFRAAAALGMDAVVLCDSCSDPLYRRSVRVSMGTVFQIPWTVADTSEASIISQLHALGFAAASMALEDNSVSISDERLRREEKLAVLLGSEGYGLKAETVSESDYVIKIPMTNGVDSLNVAAASAVAFWELGKNQ